LSPDRPTQSRSLLRCRLTWLIVLAAALPERIVSSPLLVSMVKAGRLGRKTAAGFFSYGGPASGIAPSTPDRALAEILAPWINSPPPRQTPESLAHRLVLPMLLEATYLLEEGKVGDVRDVDLAMLFGLGFPAEKGGLLWWADTLGAEQIIALLPSLGTKGWPAEPSAMLKNLARTGKKFYRLPRKPLPLPEGVYHGGIADAVAPLEWP